MIKIFAFPSFTTKDRQSGVDYVRMSLPMKELGKQDGFKVDIYDAKAEENMVWDEVVPKYDAIYFNYLNNAVGFAMMGCMARKHGKKLIMDIDDNLWNILSDNPAYNVWKPGSQAIKEITAIVNEVDYVTCTNQYLKNAIMAKTNKKSDKIFVLPNRIDIDDVYTYRRPFRDNPYFTITHFGSTTHFKSIDSDEFVAGMDKLMKNYPNVRFRTVGSFMPRFKEMWGARYESVSGSPDLMTWIKKRMPEVLVDTDIMAVPLVDNVYNRCKSSIKFLEASSAHIPGCWQDIRQYREVVKPGYNGLLCKTAKDWYKNMKMLVDNPTLRRKMGEAAFETVEEDWQMKSNIKDYIALFKQIV